VHKGRALIDSGPLIALFDRDDAFHEPAKDFLRNYVGTLHTSLAVITEVTHLLDFSVRAQIDLLEWIRSGAVSIETIGCDDLNSICRMTAKYADLTMDFADATLVQIAEREKISNVVSIDRDFYIYRKSNRSCLKNLFPRT
jgi:predicted nucleic acid-binding protein